jgi:hypothetical protein
MRNAVAWISVLLLAVACFAPWTEVTTFRGESLLFGAMNEYTNGAQYLIVCAAGAAVGLVARRRGVTSTCAAVAVLLSVWIMYEAPGTMLQIGYEAHLTWGAGLALASSLALLVVGRPVARARVAVAP